MRLAQIARKLKVKTSEVVAFVDQKFEDQIQNAPNTKIPDEYVNDIIAHFSVVEEETIQKEKVKEDSTVLETSIEKIQEADKAEEVLETENKLDSDQSKSATDSVTHQDKELNIEDGVIKAPKAEVKGIKVVGKIDLPGQKTEEGESTEETEQSEVIEESKEESSPVSEIKEEKQEDVKVEKEEPIVQATQPASKRADNPPKNKSNKKSLTYEEERTLKQKAYGDELQRLKEIDKAKKKANYEQMMQERTAKSSPKKSKTKITKKENSKPATKKVVKKKVVPTTIWGKFIFWLNN